MSDFFSYDNTYLKCKECDQIYKIPISNEEINVCCKKCGHEFLWKPTLRNSFLSGWYKESGKKINSNYQTQNLGILTTGLSFLSQDDLLRWLKQFTETTATMYDDAMDANYLKTHIGGSNHRLFDAGHDPIGAWNSVVNASEIDSFSSEVIGYVSAIFKDMSTIKGMPFLTVDKEWYDTSSEWVGSNIPGASKNWFSDFLTYDTFEVMSSAIGVCAAIFFLKKKDKEKLSEILGSMGIVTIFAANPLMAISVICMTAYSYYKVKSKLSSSSIVKGISTATISWLIFTILGLPIIIELVLAIIVVKFVRKHNFSPREILDVIISKWNNLNPEQRNNLQISNN